MPCTYDCYIGLPSLNSIAVQVRSFTFSSVGVPPVTNRSFFPYTSLPLFEQLEPILTARDVAALKVPALADASDDVILRLFDVAMSCTAMPTSKRPNTIQLVAELEALWSQLTGAAAELNEKVDGALRHMGPNTAKTLLEEFDDIGLV